MYIQNFYSLRRKSKKRMADALLPYKNFDAWQLNTQFRIEINYFWVYQKKSLSLYLNFNVKFYLK
ncbi:hypothetical protein CGC52_08055 [Capnocytophaga sp. H2931]|nr:hypothetical protein CGC52_08055 [Capnocytophaga sp. H2931]